MNLILKPVQLILGLVLAGLLGYALLNHFAPGMAAKARHTLENARQWSEEDKQKDPVGYLEYTRQRLRGQKAALEDILRDLRENQAPLAQHIQERTEELAKTTAFLKEGREVYQHALKVSETREVEGIKFAGRTYPNLETFKAQLELLFNEKQSAEAMLEKAGQTERRLDEKLYTVMVQRGRVEMALKEIQAQVAIVKASSAVNEMEDLIAAGDSVTAGVLAQTDRLVEDYAPIGTTSELLESAQKASASNGGGLNPQFEAFLEEEGAG